MLRTCYLMQSMWISPSPELCVYISAYRHSFYHGSPSSQRVECGECVRIWLISFCKKQTHTQTYTHAHLSVHLALWCGEDKASGSKTVSMSKAIGIHYSIIQHRELKASGWDGEEKKKTALHGHEQRGNRQQLVQMREWVRGCPVAG